MIRSQQRRRRGYDIQQRQIVETKEIDKDRQVRRRAFRGPAINIASQRRKDLIAKQQERQTADILRNQAIRPRTSSASGVNRKARARGRHRQPSSAVPRLSRTACR